MIGPVAEPAAGDGDSMLAGRLLVAAPALRDGNFDRTVVCVVDHGPPGALGVVLNRPTEVLVAEILPAWSAQAELAPPDRVFHGGPVSPGAVIGLARGAEGEPAGWHRVVGAVGTVDLSVAPSDHPAALLGARLFAGYAGWAPGQLEAELDAEAWFVVDARAEDVLCVRPERLWHDVLRRQGGRLALLASYPQEPTVN